MEEFLRKTLQEMLIFIATWKHSISISSVNIVPEYCTSYKNRREVILNQLCGENVTNNILSDTTCYHCHKMHGYEKDYDYKIG